MGLNKSTLSEQIYQILRNDILTQKIPCGEKLTLKLLQERFQVSSTPIREALTRLTQDQLVSYYSNVGIRVISFTADDLREILLWGILMGWRSVMLLSLRIRKNYRQRSQRFWKRNVQLPKPLMCKPGTGIPTNSISFFTVTATTPDLQSPPNGSEAGFLFFPTSTAGKP